MRPQRGNNGAEPFHTERFQRVTVLTIEEAASEGTASRCPYEGLLSQKNSHLKEFHSLHLSLLYFCYL